MFSELREKLAEMHADKVEIQKRRQVSSLRRNLGYPLVTLFVLALTVMPLLCCLTLRLHCKKHIMLHMGIGVFLIISILKVNAN